jgi:hypothetical protein
MPKLLIFLVSIIFFGCSKNGFEGNAKFFTGQPARGIKIEASTDTKIKEEKKKATLVTISDELGNFRFNDLLANKRYCVSTNDNNVHSYTIDFTAPEKGIFQDDKTLMVFPFTKEKGWYRVNMNDEPLNFIRCEVDPVVKYFIDISGSEQFMIKGSDLNGGIELSHEEVLMISPSSDYTLVRVLFHKPEKDIQNNNIDDYLKIETSELNLSKREYYHFVELDYSLYILKNIDDGFYILWDKNLADGIRAKGYRGAANFFKIGASSFEKSLVISNAERNSIRDERKQQRMIQQDAAREQMRELVKKSTQSGKSDKGQ